MTSRASWAGSRGESPYARVTPETVAGLLRTHTRQGALLAAAGKRHRRSALRSLRNWIRGNPARVASEPRGTRWCAVLLGWLHGVPLCFCWASGASHLLNGGAGANRPGAIIARLPLSLHPSLPFFLQQRILLVRLDFARVLCSLTRLPPIGSGERCWTEWRIPQSIVSENANIL